MKTQRNDKTFMLFVAVGIMAAAVAFISDYVDHVDKGKNAHQSQLPVKKPYEANCFPNRTVIKLMMVNEYEIEEAISDISKKYEIEEVIPLRPCEYRVIALPKLPNDPNSPSS